MQFACSFAPATTNATRGGAKLPVAPSFHIRHLQAGLSTNDGVYRSVSTEMAHLSLRWAKVGRTWLMHSIGRRAFAAVADLYSDVSRFGLCIRR